MKAEEIIDALHENGLTEEEKETENLSGEAKWQYNSFSKCSKKTKRAYEK